MTKTARSQKLLHKITLCIFRFCKCIYTHKLLTFIRVTRIILHNFLIITRVQKDPICNRTTCSKKWIWRHSTSLINKLTIDTATRHIIQTTDKYPDMWQTSGHSGIWPCYWLSSFWSLEGTCHHIHRFKVHISWTLEDESNILLLNIINQCCNINIPEDRIFNYTLWRPPNSHIRGYHNFLNYC